MLRSSCLWSGIGGFVAGDVIVGNSRASRFSRAGHISTNSSWQGVPGISVVEVPHHDG